MENQEKQEQDGGTDSNTENTGILIFSLEVTNISSMALGLILTIVGCVLLECFCPVAVQNALSTCCCHQIGQEPPIVPIVHQRSCSTFLPISHMLQPSASRETAELPSAPHYYETADKPKCGILVNLPWMIWFSLWNTMVSVCEYYNFVKKNQKTSMTTFSDNYDCYQLHLMIYFVCVLIHFFL